MTIDDTYQAPVVAFDFDKTLSTHRSGEGPEWTGDPILPMVSMVFDCIAHGYDVWILTARVNPANPDAAVSEAAIKAWCVKHLGLDLPVTCMKSKHMIAMYDDKAIQIVPNTGRRVDGLDGQLPTP